MSLILFETNYIIDILYIIYAIGEHVEFRVYLLSCKIYYHRCRIFFCVTLSERPFYVLRILYVLHMLEVKYTFMRNLEL